jgi:hypothetical protein
MPLGHNAWQYVTTDGQSASLSWNKAPIWGLRPDLYYCQTVAGLLTRGRACRLPVPQSAVISLLSVCIIYILYVIKCMYIQYIQGLSQSRLSTTDHVLSLVAPATTAVQSLERSYAWWPPRLSLLYFLLQLISKLVSVITSRLGQRIKRRSFLYSDNFHGNVFVCEGVTQ